MTENPVTENPDADRPRTVDEGQLPAELDITRPQGPYTFPNIRRRRIAAVLYWITAGGSALGGAATTNGGMVAGGLALGALGAYSWACGWDLRINQTDALVAAIRAVGFPVGHASAALAWRGLRSRPTWRVLLYSADDPPSRRGLVELDGVDGGLLTSFSEENPEDWSGLAIPDRSP